MNNTIINILRKKIKTNYELKLIYEFFIKINLFEILFSKHFNKNIFTFDNFIKINSIFKFKTFWKNEIIFYENEKKNLNFYFIINGRIGIYKRKKSFNDLNIFEKKTNTKKKKSSVSNLFFNKNKKILGICLRILKMNDFFGENAIFSKIKRRTASVICWEETHLLYISYQDFISNIENLWKIENNKLKKLLIKITNEIFIRLNFDKIIQITKTIFFEKNYILLKQGDIINNLYLILEGEVEVVHEIMNKKKINNFNYKPHIILQNLGEGIFIGEKSLLNKNVISNYTYIVKSIYSKILKFSFSENDNDQSIKNNFKKIIKENTKYMNTLRKQRLKDYYKNILDNNIKIKNQNKIKIDKKDKNKLEFNNVDFNLNKFNKFSFYLNYLYNNEKNSFYLKKESHIIDYLNKNHLKFKKIKKIKKCKSKQFKIFSNISSNKVKNDSSYNSKIIKNKIKLKNINIENNNKKENRNLKYFLNKYINKKNKSIDHQHNIRYNKTENFYSVDKLITISNYQ